MRLCAVDHAALKLYDGERRVPVAVHGHPERFADKSYWNGYRLG